MGQQQIKTQELEVASYAWIILAVSFIASVAAPLNQFKVSPVMPVLMEAFNLNLTNAGMLMSVFAITGFVLALPGGLILQRLGLRITGLIAMGCLALGSIVGAIAPSAGILLSSRVIEGVGMGLIAVMAPASIAMWFPREKQGTPMGLWATWVPVGSLIMFLTAPALNNVFGWQSIWWFSAAFALLAFVLVWFFMKMPPAAAALEHSGEITSPKEIPDTKKALANRHIWFLAASFGFFNMALISMSTFYPTFLSTVHSYSMATAAFITSITMIVVIFAAPLAGIFSDKIGSRKALITWPFIILAIMMLFPYTINGAWIIVWTAAMGLIAGAIPTATFAAAPEIMIKPEYAGMGMAVLTLGQNLGMFLGPLLFGAIVESAGWATAGYWMIPILGLGLFSGWLVKVR